MNIGDKAAIGGALSLPSEIKPGRGMFEGAPPKGCKQPFHVREGCVYLFPHQEGLTEGISPNLDFPNNDSL